MEVPFFITKVPATIPEQAKSSKKEKKNQENLIYG